MHPHSTEFLLFSGSSHEELAQEVADYLGVSLGKRNLTQFPDGEYSLQILETVRGRDVFVLQSVALEPNNYLMELLVFVDALKRSSARSINVILTYYGYSRQDRKDKPHVPITAKLVADLLGAAGVTRIITMDLHAGQLEGFFNVPVDNIPGRVALAEAVKALQLKDLVVVAPDIGSGKLVRDYAAHLGVDFAIVEKVRHSAIDVKATIVIGEIGDRDVLLADDMCSTGGTLVSAAKACQEKGARRIIGVVTHGIFVGPAIERIEESPIERLLVSNTIPQTERLKDAAKLQYVSVAPLFGQAINSFLSRRSLATLYAVNPSQG